MSILSNLFVLLSIFSITLIRGFKLNFSRNIQRNRRLSMRDPFIETLVSNLAGNAVPAVVGIYILTLQNNAQKESLTALEKILTLQNNAQKEALAAQDKSQKEALAAQKESLLAQDKSLKEALAAQDKLWNARFEKVFDRISK